MFGGMWQKMFWHMLQKAVFWCHVVKGGILMVCGKGGVLYHVAGWFWWHMVKGCFVAYGKCCFHGILQGVGFIMVARMFNFRCQCQTTTKTSIVISCGMWQVVFISRDSGHWWAWPSFPLAMIQVIITPKKFWAYKGITRSICPSQLGKRGIFL